MRQVNLVLLSLTLCGAMILPAQAVKRITKLEAVGAATTKIQPEYPPVARQLKLEGSVELEADVGETGSVTEVREVSGNPVLAKAAATALRKWRFRPFQAEGKPVRAIAVLSFQFHSR
jgi:protein TonB